MTQEEIARGVGTNQGGVSAWELKKVVPGSLYLMRLIRTCSRPGAVWDANWVLTGKGQEFLSPPDETQNEAYVRAGLTILAKLDKATEAFRRDIGA